MLLRKATDYLSYTLNKIIKKSLHPSVDDLANHHLSAETAEIVNISKKSQAYLRPSFSDKARVAEYNQEIYLPECTLTDALKAYKPNVLVDIGANIGLSSLALAESIPTLKKVIGVEAEQENFRVLRQNYNLWSDSLNSEFVSIYGVASANGMSAIVASALPGGVSASGTFMFTNSNTEQTETIRRPITFGPSLKVSDILLHLHPSDKVIVKVDIEGGEEFLFDNSDNWLERIAFLTIELHDRFGLPNSSRTVFNLLASGDFAVYPREDTLHCYNRKLLSL